MTNAAGAVAATVLLNDKNKKYIYGLEVDLKLENIEITLVIQKRFSCKEDVCLNGDIFHTDGDFFLLSKSLNGAVTNYLINDVRCLEKYENKGWWRFLSPKLLKHNHLANGELYERFGECEIEVVSKRVIEFSATN